jgi:low temperature requirement protein LtrA
MAAATVSSGQHAARSVILSPRRRTWMARASLHPVRLSPPPLRTADGHHREERRASWLELFFDLAFAGAVGQLASAFQEHPGLGTLARFVMLFTPIWWLWVQLSFYADRHESDDAAHRISFLAAILLCVGLATCAPRALSGDTAGFVVAFACLRGLQLLLYARARHHLPATRPLYNCYLICFGAGGALWLSSLAVAGSGRYAFWAAALVTDATGALAMLAPRRRVPLNHAHLADRFQIFVLIVLGESVARLISAAAIRSWSLPLAVVLTAALIALAALWWAWLTAADRQALDSQPAIAGFTALNLPAVAGIAAASTGLHIAILAAEGAGTIAAGPRAALYGGVSVYLLATAILPSKKMTPPARAVRLATALAAMGLVFMGAIVEPVYLVPALTAVLVLGLAAETRAGSPARMARQRRERVGAPGARPDRADRSRAAGRLPDRGVTNRDAAAVLFVGVRTVRTPVALDRPQAGRAHPRGAGPRLCGPSGRQQARRLSSSSDAAASARAGVG